MKVRVIPTEGEAFQWNGNIFAAKQFAATAKLVSCNSKNQLNVIMIDGGERVVVEPGHYLIIAGDKLSTCNELQFTNTYEVIEEKQKEVTNKK